MADAKLIIAIVHARNLTTGKSEEIMLELEHKPESRDLLKRYVSNKLGRAYEVHKINVRTIKVKEYERFHMPKIPTIDV